MSSITGKITKSLVASASAAGMLLVGVTSASADHRWRNNGWHSGSTKKVVIIHKNRDAWPDRNYRMRPAKVVHIYHSAPVYRPHQVKLVRHYETRRPDPSIVFSSETSGAILGGVIGAVAGTQIGKGSGRVAAVISGTVLGAIMGGRIGR